MLKKIMEPYLRAISKAFQWISRNPFCIPAVATVPVAYVAFMDSGTGKALVAALFFSYGLARAVKDVGRARQKERMDDLLRMKRFTNKKDGRISIKESDRVKALVFLAEVEDFLDSYR